MAADRTRGRYRPVGTDRARLQRRSVPLPPRALGFRAYRPARVGSRVGTNRRGSVPTPLEPALEGMKNKKPFRRSTGIGFLSKLLKFRVGVQAEVWVGDDLHPFTPVISAELRKGVGTGSEGRRCQVLQGSGGGDSRLGTAAGGGMSRWRPARCGWRREGSSATASLAVTREE